MIQTKMHIKGLLIDLDGVIYNDSSPIPGADQTIKFLNEVQVPFRFITNTTMKSRISLQKKLAQMGIHCPHSYIFSSVYAAACYVRQFPESDCFLLLTDDAKSEFAGLESKQEKVDFVVSGDLGTEMTYNILNEAFLKLFDGAKLIALQKNRFWLSDAGYRIDAGAFVALLEYAANTNSLLIGKPAKTFFDLALADLGLLPANVMMVGDDIESDIRGAEAMGIKTCLVKTGKFRQQDLDRSGVKPDLLIESFSELQKTGIL